MISDLKPYAEYKESGLPWLGQVPGHWEVVALRHVTRPAKGRQPRRLFSNADAPESAKPYLNIQYIRQHAGPATTLCLEQEGLVYAELGDVLLLWDGANAGELFLAKEGVVSSTSALLKFSVHDKKYVYFALKQCEPRLRALSVGMGIPHVDGVVLKAMCVTLPPPAEQAAIVRFLDWANGRLERAIRAKKKIIALLNEQKQAIIHRAVTRGLDPSVPLKDSGVPWLGEIPKHWEVRRLRASVSDCVNGIWGGEPDGVDDLTCVRVADFDRKLLRVNLNRRTTRSIPQGARTRRVLSRGDLLLEKSGGGERQPVGAVVIYDFEEPAVCSNFVARMPVADGYDSKFVNYLHSALYARRVNVPSIKQTTGIQNLDGKAYLSERVAFPDLEEQRLIAGFLDEEAARFDTVISRLEREITLLREYRTRLVADVVTGKLDVRAAAASLLDEAPLDDATASPDPDDDALDTDDLTDTEADA
jgi:type I restriction enzyme S subunit